jgi:hypothetical protein
MAAEVGHPVIEKFLGTMSTPTSKHELECVSNASVSAGLQEIRCDERRLVRKYDWFLLPPLAFM